MLPIYGMLKKVEVENFNKDLWASDPNGCKKERIDLIDNINDNKKKILWSLSKRHSEDFLVSLKNKNYTKEAKLITSIILIHLQTVKRQ